MLRFARKRGILDQRNGPAGGHAARGPSSVCDGVTTATGRPRETMVTVAPPATSRSKREKWRLASVAVMVFTMSLEVVLGTTLASGTGAVNIQFHTDIDYWGRGFPYRHFPPFPELNRGRVFSLRSR